jgi:hypothetical protein
MSQVIAVNVKTGAVSAMPLEVWEKIKDTPGWKGVFYLKEVAVPPEVTKLRKSKKETKNVL